MASVVIPPWLNIDPTAPVDRLLSGYGQGRAAGAGRRNAELQEGELAFREQASADELRRRQEESQENSALRQQALDIQSKRYQEEMRLKQSLAAMKAREAAIQLEGMQGLEADIQGGVPFATAFPKHAAKILFKSPQALAPSMASVDKMGPVQPPIFGTSPEGYPYMQNARTGASAYVPGSVLKSMTPGSNLTTGVKGKLQTSLLQGDKAAELGTELWNKLSDEAVGLKGVYNRVVINEGLAQLFPSLHKGDIADAQSLISNFNEKAVAAITASGDKRVSNADMIRYQRMLPKLTGGESVKDARQKIKTFMDELRVEATKDADRLGQERPLWTMSKDEIRALYKAGKLSKEEAAQAIERYHPLEK